MKKKLFFVICLLVACLTLAMVACDKVPTDETHTISVSWSEGVEGVIFTQGGERLLPKNGKLTTASEEDIQVEITLKAGYKQNVPVVTVDGKAAGANKVPASANAIVISVEPNEEVSLLLGEGVGYRVTELKRVENEVGFTAVVGIYLEEGYRELSAPKVSILVLGAEYEAIASLNAYGLDATQLKQEGYHSFYRLDVLENTTVGVIGVVADEEAPEEYATVTHLGGEGYSLRALVDNNNDGIADSEQLLLGETTFVKGTVINIVIRRDSAYSTANAKLFANGTEVVGTQGEGYDDSDPFSNELIYLIRVNGDLELTVTGVKPLGQFVLHIMNADGTQRYRTFCRADSLADALAQIPGNDARDNEAYERWWEPNPGESYQFKYWRFVEREFVEVGTDYIPGLYEDVYCGYVAEGTTPDDPMDRPTIPETPEAPVVPSADELPDSLKDAMAKVAQLTTSDKESKQWVLAWASYQLYKAGVSDIERPAVFGYSNVYDAWYDDLISDYIKVSANDLWVYAFDMAATGSSVVDLQGSLMSSFLNPNNGSKRNWANNEAIILEIVELIPGFEPKTSFTIGQKDDLNMTISLILDRLGVAWTLSGTPVNGYTVESYREYVKENAAQQVMANVVQEVFAFIDSLNA